LSEKCRVRVLGIGFDAISLADAAGRIGWKIGDRPGDGGPLLVVTANPEMVELARADEGLRSILERVDLVLPDGIGVVWAGRVLGTPFPERVPGADLVEALLRTGAQRGWRFFFLGGRPGDAANPPVAGAAAAKVEERYPGVRVTGYAHGYLPQSEEDGVVEQINESGADILLVGMGVPMQEKWMWRHRDSLRVSACIGVGGMLDVLSGAVKRAPVAFRRAGLEWMYRLVTQPSRFARMLRLPVFAANVLKERFWRDARER